jgi:hypothetical protein
MPVFFCFEAWLLGKPWSCELHCVGKQIGFDGAWVRLQRGLLDLKFDDPFRPKVARGESGSMVSRW